MIALKMKNDRAAEGVEELLSVLRQFQSLSSSVDQAGHVLIQALKQGNKILTCGNGGSAADALHMAEEIMGRYKSNRPPLPAISLVADPTLLTCIANDFGYESVFSRQIEGLAQRGDVLIGFSSSGNSPNVLNAAIAARNRDMVSIALLGNAGGAMRGHADYEIIVPSSTTARIQEIHTLILHCWLEQIEMEFSQ